MPEFLNKGLRKNWESLVKIQCQDFSQCTYSRKITMVFMAAGLTTQRIGILIGLCLPVFPNLFMALSAFILSSPVLVPLSSPSPEI